MNYDRLRKWLKHDEGFRSKPYKDTEGILTVAYGRNLDAVGLSEPEGEILLDNDIAKVVAEIRGFSWFSKLDEVRKEVIVQMAFNLGLSRLLSFKKMIAAIDAGYFHIAADEMVNSKWHDQVGDRAKRLSSIMSSGEYPNEV